MKRFQKRSYFKLLKKLRDFNDSSKNLLHTLSEQYYQELMKEQDIYALEAHAALKLKQDEAENLLEGFITAVVASLLTE